MRLCIHHGASEIGGNCVELECAGQRLLLDLGLPLQTEAILPPVSGLLVADPNLLGVVLSHPHLDHYGLLPQARADLPVWLGKAAIRLLKAAAPFTGGGRLPQELHPYSDREPFTVGPFVVTPYLVDHSAFDAFALLVEAGGKRVFYSGDFRGHGRKGWAFERLLTAPPADIDVLLMEGTTLGRNQDLFTEHDVEDRAAEIMSTTSGAVLACFSGQNIDRFVSFYKACVRSGRVFVIDAYMANLIRALELSSLPNPASSPLLRVFLPAQQRRAILRSGAFELIDAFRGRRIYVDEIARQPGQFTLMFRGSMAGDLRTVEMKGGALLYSLWPGYLAQDWLDLRRWASERGLSFQIVHSSGHAPPAALKRFAQALNPGQLLPIHTADLKAFSSLLSGAVSVPNGRWIDI